MKVAIHLTTPQSEDQWSYVLTHFQPDEIILLGDYEPTDKTYKGAKRALPTRNLVIMAPKDGRYIQGEVSLIGFKHPKNACYVFGPDNAHLSDIDGKKVYIPTDSPHDMYSWVAGAITLWHRRNG